MAAKAKLHLIFKHTRCTFIYKIARKRVEKSDVTARRRTIDATFLYFTDATRSRSRFPPGGRFNDRPRSRKKEEKKKKREKRKKNDVKRRGDRSEHRNYARSVSDRITGTR